MSEPAAPPRIAVVGAGSIGVSWAVVFARAGHAVALHDADAGRLPLALQEARARLDDLAEYDLLDELPADVAARITASPELGNAVRGASHVQECAPERIELKRELFARVESIASGDAVLASSSSALLPTDIFGGIVTRERCLVAHPANPPHLLPIVELVGAAFTAEPALVRTETLLSGASMSPVRVGEVEGFVLNRLQGAVLREAYCLVRDGVVDVEGLDRVVREGLGRRWSIVGPFETSDLNTRGGIAVHAGRMGPAYARMGADRGQDDPWTPELVNDVVDQRRSLLPLSEWDERVRWRDRMLLVLERARCREVP